MTMQTPPGWYPDPSGRPGTRWWDGGAWTEHVGPVPPWVARPRLAPGTRTETWFLWAMVLLPLLAIPIGFAYSPTYRFEEIAPGVRTIDPSSIYSAGYFVTQGLGLLFYGVNVLLALFDRRHLADLGVVRPFHWAWSFFGSVVYLIGRFVVLRKVAPGTRLWPLWLFLVLLAASIGIAIIRSFLLVLGQFA